MDQLIGIPGTLSEEGRRIRWFRCEDMSSGGRAYKADLPDGILAALVTQDEVAPGKLLWHLSVSHRDRDNRPDRCPNWDECKSAFYRLVQVDVPFVLIFPRRSAPYVNIHPTTLHFWQSDKEVDL